MSFIFKERTNFPSILLSSGGESNEPGYGVNSNLTSGELAVRGIEILNPASTQVQSLHIGASNGNNLGTTLTQHGFENQIANDFDTGQFGGRAVYICKTGRGQTRSHQWLPGTFLYERMIQRIEFALSRIKEDTLTSPIMWHMWTLGINDMFDGKNASTFKSEMYQIMDAMLERYPKMKFIMTKFNQTIYQAYNTTIDTMGTERAGNLWIIYSASASLVVTPSPADTHWDENGWKTLGAQMTNIIVNN